MQALLASISMLVTCARNLCIWFGYELHFQKAIPILAKMMNRHLIIIMNWHLIMIMFWIGSGAEVLRRKFLIWSSYPFLNSFSFTHSISLNLNLFHEASLFTVSNPSEMINEIVGCFYEHRIVVTVFILCQHLPHLYWILQFLIMYWCTFHSVRYVCSWEKLLWLDIVLEIWWAYHMNCSIK